MKGGRKRGKIKLPEPQITEWFSESVDKAKEHSLSLSHTEPHVLQEWAGGINPLCSVRHGLRPAWEKQGLSADATADASDHEGPHFPCWLREETRVARLHGFHSGDARSDSVTCGEMVCVCIMQVNKDEI